MYYDEFVFRDSLDVIFINILWQLIELYKLNRFFRKKTSLRNCNWFKI